MLTIYNFYRRYAVVEHGTNSNGCKRNIDQRSKGVLLVHTPNTNVQPLNVNKLSSSDGDTGVSIPSDVW